MRIGEAQALCRKLRNPSLPERVAEILRWEGVAAEAPWGDTS